MTCTAEPVAWDQHDPEHWIALVGTATFHYYPSERTMEWRGITFYGVDRTDIDRFVHNRTDR